MSEFDLAVMVGTLVTPAGQARSNVYVTDGRVALVDEAVHPAPEVIEAGGLLVMPGMVDTHAHLMDPGDSTREDFPHGTGAAVISKAGWSPYAGRRGRGSVEAVYLRGRKVALGGSPLDEFNGRFLPGEGKQI